jgi:hypothetical protein
MDRTDRFYRVLADYAITRPAAELVAGTTGKVKEFLQGLDAGPM